LTCDLCGDPIWDDEPATTVIGRYDDHDNNEGGDAEDLLACPDCIEIGPGINIWHKRWNIVTVIGDYR